ncbi:SagB family peptide dehydrogenase [Bradyrhizobium sp. dw_78]|uniref:SagB/ThcOx family dehydrogenase n=1 Tax=Bradyrhizobium sp. dw_78 TaxID=2719793 RepID=UPI001BD51B57|nr:SagB family peptide dehydrogenase [Bradyrhizobium sp. dw_78]
MLEAQADGSLDAWFDGYSTGLGNFSAAAIGRAQDLSTGLRLSSFSPDGKPVEKEIDVLVRRLARRGLVEYRLAHPADAKELVAIEPQLPDYWPRTLKPDNADVIALSRFAYLRRRGGEMVLESPRAGALFRIGDPKIASILALLATPQKISRLRRQDGFPGMEFLGLLMDCRILFKVEAEGDGFRADEGDDNLVLWDFHDLLFHARSTEGRQANPIGGLYPFAGIMPPPPAVRPSWPGKQIDMDGFLDGFNALSEPLPGIAGVLRERHSVRDFDDTRPVTLTELSRFLDGSARILSKWESPLDPEDGDSPLIDYTTRPYPSGGSSYELELYLAAANCEGLTRGFYHYDAGRHALTPIDVRPQDFDAMLTSAELAMDAPGAPQILITIAARFGRISWKYSGLAYSLILKDVGVLMQTFYMVATGMGLGGCAIGTNNIELFAKMTHIDFHVEGPVGQFAVGRALPDQP